MIIKAYTPVSWQRVGHTYLNTHQRDSILVIKSHRQVGKSLFLLNALLFQSVNYPKSVSYFISPTLSQSRKVYKELISSIGNAPIVRMKNSTLLDIEFINGSEIHMKSAEQGDDALRGYTCKGHGILCIDEAAYISDEIFSNVLNYTNVNKSVVVITSTPKFESGFFYDLYLKGLSGNTNVHTIDVNDYDTSMFLNDERKQFYKNTMSLIQYQTDILGMFIKEYSSVFGNFSKVCSNNYNVNDHTYYFGIDWGSGSKQDRTAISIFNSSLQQVALHYFDDKDAQQTVDYIIKLVEEYKPVKLVVEQNSIGKILGDLLRKSLFGKQTIFKYFNTTNESKNKLVNQLQLAISNQNIQLLDNVDLKIELTNYQVESTRTGKVTYNASKGQHDDLVIATMIAFDAAKNKTTINLG